MSTTECGVCGKAHPTSECINVTVHFECPCCDKEDSNAKEEKCVCPACERQMACKEDEFRAKCKQPPVCVPEIELEPEDESCNQSYPNMRDFCKENAHETEDECPPCPCTCDDSKSKVEIECHNGSATKDRIQNIPCKMCQLEEDEDKRVGSIRAAHTAEKRRQAEEKRQKEIDRLEEIRRCEEEKCVEELRKQFIDECIKEQQILQEERRKELEKCRALEANPLEECDCEEEEDKCAEVKPKIEQCSYDLRNSMNNLNLQSSTVITPTDESISNKNKTDEN